MLIDMHAHSSGISRCCRIPYDEVLRTALSFGMDGVVLTNHYQKNYITDGDAAAFAERYVEEYCTAQKYGEEIGCRVFFGIEVTAELYKNVHLLVYGVDPAFLLAHPTLYDCTQKALYDLVKAAGGLLVQAHPFRNGTTVLDTALLDGVEINCHPLYKKSYAKELLEIAEKEHLLVTCGGDYHADTYRATCGAIVPDSVKDIHDIAAFLCSDTEKTLCIHEPGEEKFENVSVEPFHAL